MGGVNYVLEDLVAKAWEELNDPSFNQGEPPTEEEFAADLRTLADQYEQDAE